jgi:hypothetical protein
VNLAKPKLEPAEFSHHTFILRENLAKPKLEPPDDGHQRKNLSKKCLNRRTPKQNQSHEEN